MEAVRLDGFITPWTPVRSALLEVVQRLCSCFKRISIDPTLTDAAWAHLASLPELESFWVHGVPSTEISKLVPHERTVPVLRRMVVVASDVGQDLPLLFPLLECSPLRRVKVVASSGVQYGDVPSQVTVAMFGAKLQQTIDALIFHGFIPASLTFVSHVRPFSSVRTLECHTRCRQSGQCVSPLTDPDVE